MQSTMFKSIHHTISTLACLALAGTLAACGGGGGGGDGTTTPTPNGGANEPAITFAKTSTEDRTQTYAGAFPGGTFTNKATATAKGKCTTPPKAFTYTSSNAIDAAVHPTTGLVTYTAATEGRTPYTITAATQAETSGDSVCAAASKSYILTVNQADADFTFDSSITRRVGIKGGTALYLESVRGIPSDTSAGVDTGGAISYSSADTGKASVDANTGVVTGGDSTGEVRITATYSGSKNYKKTTAGYDLEISNQVPKSISFDNAEVTADYAGAIGRTYTQTADVSVDTADVSVDDEVNSLCQTPPGVTYTSSNVTDASVDASGAVTYKAAGTYIITATTDEERSDDSVVCYSISSAYTLIVNKATAKLAFDRSTDKAGAGGGMTTNLARLGDPTGGDATTDMGGHIRYFSTNETLARVDASGTVTTIYSGTDVTTVVIYARYTGSPNYNDITGSATTKPHYTLSIGRAPLAISFNGLSNDPTSHDVTYGGVRGVEITSIATDVSGVDANGYCPTRPVIAYSSIDTSTEATTDKITFSNATPDTTPGAVTYTAAGSYRITATTAVTPGCGTESNSYTLNVAKANPVFSFTSSTTSVLPDATKPYPVSLTGVGRDTRVDIGGTISYTSNNTNDASVDASGEVTAGSNPASVVITATYSGTSNYNDATASYTLNISNNTPTITFNVFNPDGINDTTSVTYAGRQGADFTNDATVTGAGQCSGTNLPDATYSSDNTANAPVNTSGVVTYKAAGSYRITASTKATSGDPKCDAASAQYTLIVNKATATLAFDNPTDKLGAGGGTTTNSASLDNTTTDPDTIAAMGGTISYYSSKPSDASVDVNSGDVTAIYTATEVTTVVIYATFTESPNYNDITGSATTKPNYTLNIGRVRPTVSFTGLAAGDLTHDVTYGGVQGVDVTSITVDISGVDASGFCTTTPDVTYSISRGPNNPTGDTNVSVNATTGAVTYTAAGTYRITARTKLAPGCAEADATYDLTVNKAKPTIKFTTPTTRVAIGATITNLAELTGVGGDPTTGVNGEILDGASITYSNNNPSDATVDASTGAVTGKLISGTSGVTITATYPGSDNYKDVSGEYSLEVTLDAADLDVSSSPIKKLIFSWQDVTGAAYYRLLQVHGGEMDDTQVGQNVTAGNTGGTQSITRIVPLFASAGTQYMLASCDSAKECTPPTNVQTITQPQLNRAIGYIKASNTGGEDYFGYRLSLSADGTTLAVGAPYEDSSADGVGNSKDRWDEMDNDNIRRAGAVYVFSRDVSTDGNSYWIQRAYIKASNTGNGDQFGAILSLSADGTTLAVGARYEDSSADGVGNSKARWDEMDNNNADGDGSGAVYVFSRDASGAWSQQAYIKASNTGAIDEFGASVSLSADGTTLAVGATGEDSSAYGVGNGQVEWDVMDNGGAISAGAVYVFSRTNSTSRDWTQRAYIKASNTGVIDIFGISLSLNSDGTTLAVGAHNEDSSADGVYNTATEWNARGGGGAGNSGAVYVFSRTSSTSRDWTQRAYIKASNTGERDYFGASLSLSTDGTTLAVGAYGEDSDATGIDGNQSDGGINYAKSGAVYVFTRPNNTSSDWTQDAYIKASNTGKDDEFGLSLSLNSDGTTLAVGARYEDSSADGVGGNQSDNSADGAGAVYVFTRTSSTSRDWSQQSYIKASNTGSDDEFGWSLSLDASGDTLAVGAHREDSNATGIGGDQSNGGAGSAGAVYLY